MSFTEKDILNFDLRQMARDQLVVNLTDTIWVSENAISDRDLLVPAHTTLPLQVSLPEDIGPFNFPARTDGLEEAFAQIAFFYAQGSTRSILMQQGVGFRDVGIRIARSLFKTEESGKVTRKAWVEATNHSQRDYQITKGMGLFRLYAFNNGYLYGKDIKEIVNPSQHRDDQVVISGEQGIDWDFEYRRDIPAEDEIVGIRMAIKEERWFLPPKGKQIPSNIDSKTFRKVSAELYKPAPLTEQPIFNIGETVSTLSLGKDVDGELFSFVLYNLQSGESISPLNCHLPSLFIDRGSSWPIRLEFFCPTSGDLKPAAVSMRVLRKNRYYDLFSNLLS